MVGIRIKMPTPRPSLEEPCCSCREELIAIFAGIGDVSEHVPDSNAFDIRVTVGQFRRARALVGK